MIGCIIQARMGSSRLPGKVLMKIDKKYTVLEYVIKQISQSKLVNKVIIATTNLEQDDVIQKVANELGIECFRGSSDNVLDRYYECAKKFSLNNILRITSDCPLIDPGIVDKVIEKYLTKDFDYVSNTLIRTFPIGMDSEIFSFDVLEKSWQNASLLSEKEHVTPYMINKKNGFRLGNIKNELNVGQLRLTLDRIEDYELIKKIVKKIGRRPIFMKDVLKLFSEEPELVKINAHIPANEGMLKSLKRDEDEKNKII
jgi:spore coat polysaccharide biosynthesis protein SpsF